MTTTNYSSVIGVMLLAILLTNFGLLVAPVISSDSVEEQRTNCLSRCNLPSGLDTYSFRGGGGDGLWRLRSICIEKCERRFWKEWQKEMDEIEGG
ncbi:MAG: hypothetical protein V1897_18700 [Pseudomonadota bacterium]